MSKIEKFQKVANFLNRSNVAQAVAECGEETSKHGHMTLDHEKVWKTLHRYDSIVTEDGTENVMTLEELTDTPEF